MNVVRKYPAWSMLAAFAVGLLIGLVVLGWWLWPVQWTDATPAQLAPQYQQAYVKMVSELFSVTNNTEMVQQALGGWSGDVTGDVVACEMAATTADPAERVRLEATAAVVNGTGCSAVGAVPPTETEPEDEGGGSGLPSWVLPAFLLLLLLGLVVAAIFWVLNRRNQSQEASVSVEPVYDDGNDQFAVQQTTTTVVSSPSDEDFTTVPIARFHTTYTYGNDAYDDSFSIENGNGEFLGECGVGIAETIGGDIPKKVTALEIWLFDKRDIRTITKVVMSDHAFFDEALKAKLAPKGEPVLARESETIVLETASLIINADITEMQYGSENDLPPQSYFDRITISLSAWSKEDGGSGQSASGEVDEMMEF